MPTPFDAQFWEEEEQSLYEDLLPLLLAGFALGLDGGTEILPSNIQPLVNPNLFNQAAIKAAREYRYNQIKGITDTTRKQVQEAMVDWIRSGQSLDVLEQTMAGIFGTARAARIAASEVTRAFALGNAAAFESTGFVNQVEIMTAEDERVCVVCSGHEGEHTDPADTDALPPFHPGCRCFIKPILDMDLVKDAQRKALGL